jgi:hypothetical protein
MGHSNYGNSDDIRHRNLSLPPDVDAMGILGCDWHLPRRAHNRDLGFLPIRSLWREPIQYFILVSRNACRGFRPFDCSEENPRQIDWHARNNQIELLNPRTICLSSRLTGDVDFADRHLIPRLSELGNSRRGVRLALLLWHSVSSMVAAAREQWCKRWTTGIFPW